MQLAQSSANTVYQIREIRANLERIAGQLESGSINPLTAQKQIDGMCNRLDLLIKG